MASSRFVDDAAATLRGQLGQEELELLAEDAIATISELLEITISIRPEARQPDGCGVDGSYFTEPPRINVAESASPGRRHFTALHELGHHLITQDVRLNDELLLMDDGGRQAEELICDRFASRVLIPDHVLDEVVPADGPCAEHVVALHDATQASRSACCVAAAERLRGEGYVLVAERDGTVVYAARSSPTFIIAPGTAQTDQSLLPVAGRLSSGHQRGNARLKFASDTLSDWFHGDAQRDGRYVFGVFTKSGSPPWGGLGMLPQDGPRGPMVSCPNCGLDFEGLGRPHRPCGEYQCWRCGECGCASGPPTVPCPNCNMTAHRDLITEEGCPDCR